MPCQVEIVLVNVEILPFDYSLKLRYIFKIGEL